VLPIATARIFNQVLKPGITHSHQVQQLSILTGVIAAVVIAMTVASLTQRYLLSKVAVQFDTDTLDHLTKTLLALPMRYFSTRRTGDIERRLACARQVRPFVTSSGIQLLTAVTQLVAALEQGPRRRGVAALPPGTAVLHAYLDDRGLMTLDLSRAFQQGFRGGTQAEDLVVGSLVRTVGANLPEVKHVLIVCGGTPIGSLGGHLPLDRPLDPHESD